MEGSRNAGGRDARRAPRYPTKIDATLRKEHEVLQVTIADISSVGAFAKGVKLPSSGSRVVLVARLLEVSATVVWVKENGCGLDFHQPVEPLEVVRQNMPGMERFRDMAKRT